MNEIVISLKRGVALNELTANDEQSLRDLVKSIATVRVSDVLPTGRRVIVTASEPALNRLKSQLEDYCHFVPRTRGHVL
jgi:hypothetical protein